MELSDIRVIDLTRLGPGTYATQLLADLDADIVKIEDSENDARRTTSREFEVLNRGKKSIAVDLKRDGGKQILLDIISKADVLIEQFRPGVMKDLGLDFETVREYNSEIIYCSVTGYGHESPHRDRVGHNLNYSSFAGLVDMTRPEDSSSPAIPGYPVADMVCGVFAALSITAALFDRELQRVPDPKYLDLSITDTVIALSQPVVTEAAENRDPRSGATLLTGKYPCYNIYETKDSKYVSLAAIEPRFWEEFCRTVNKEELIGQHMVADETARANVKTELESMFQSKSRAEWEDKFNGEGVMFSPVLTPAEMMQSEHVEARGLREESGGYTRIGFPVRANGSSVARDGAVPSVGEHTIDILRELGVAEDKIGRYREDGILQDADSSRW